MTKEEGDAVYDAYFRAFPDLKNYFAREKAKSLESGYILISTVTKRKSYLPGFARYSELAAQISGHFWEEYRSEKKIGSERFREMKRTIQDFFYFKGDIERKSLNYPIQGSSAEVTKISCIYIFDYIVENDLFGLVKFVNTIHDENVLECPVEIAEETAAKVREFMCAAGDIYCKRVSLVADPDISFHWRK